VSRHLCKVAQRYLAATINIGVLSKLVFLLEPKHSIILDTLKKTIQSQLKLRQTGRWLKPDLEVNGFFTESRLKAVKAIARKSGRS